MSETHPDSLARPGSDEHPTPSLSVIIPCHNGASTLGLQLGALASQISPPPFEVIVVDNRSADAPERVLDLLREPLLANGATDIRIVSADQEAGASYARNVGAANARSALLVFCDADDCVSAHWLNDASALFEQAPVFSGSAIPVDDARFGTDVQELVRALDAEDQPPAELVSQEELAIPILMGGNFGITRTLYLALGGFDQSLPAAGEDNDLAFRIRRAGHRNLDTRAMRIAYRRRPAGDDEYARARRAARVHVLLCVRYGVLRRSAFVGGLRLPFSTLRLFASAARMALMPSRRDFPGLRGRAAGILGFWEGILIHGVLRRNPAPRLGVGLGDIGP